MKLESVEAFPIRLKVEENLRGGTFAYTHYQTVIVRVEVDGVEGWGGGHDSVRPGRHRSHG